MSKDTSLAAVRFLPEAIEMLGLPLPTFQLILLSVMKVIITALTSAKNGRDDFHCYSESDYFEIDSV
jgi:hypothetical protein